MDKKILIIESDPISANFEKNLLYRRNFIITLVGSSSAAEQLLGALPPDLILLDLQLPDGEGMNLLRTIKSMPGAQKTPLVLITEPIEQQQVDECTILGVFKILEKPVDPPALLAAVGDALGINISREAAMSVRIEFAEDGDAPQKTVFGKSIEIRAEKIIVELGEKIPVNTNAILSLQPPGASSSFRLSGKAVDSSERSGGKFHRITFELTEPDPRLADLCRE